MNCRFTITEDTAYMEELIPDQHIVARIFVMDYTTLWSLEAGVNKLRLQGADELYEDRFSALAETNALIREYTYGYNFNEFEFVYSDLDKLYYLRFQYWLDSQYSRWVRAESLIGKSILWNTVKSHGSWHPGIVFDHSWKELMEVSK